MSEKSITINLANRPYTIKIKAEEEKTVLNAVEEINKKLKDFSTSFSYKDNQDLLAMVLLDTVAIHLTQHSENEDDHTQIKSKLNSLSQLISSSLNT